MGTHLDSIAVHFANKNSWREGCSRVDCCGTFSETISPGLRVGWIRAARDLVRKVVLAKQASDLHGASLSQMVIYRVADAEYDTLVPRVVATYRSRRDAMLEALALGMPSGVTGTRPQGGMFIWVTLPPGIDGAELLEAAIAEESIAFVPGHAFFADGSGRNTLRLNYSLQTEAAISEGMARLGRLVSRRVPVQVAA